MLVAILRVLSRTQHEVVQCSSELVHCVTPQSLGRGWSHSPGFDRRIPTAVADFVAWMAEMELPSLGIC